MDGDGPDPELASRDANRVLLLPPTHRDAQAMQQVLERAGIAGIICSNMQMLCDAAHSGVGAVVVSEEALSAASQGLMALIQSQPIWSDVPVIVLSRWGAESPALAPLLARMGNVSVLERPARITTLLSVIRSALRGRQRQYQVRTYLAELDRAARAIQAGEARYRLLVENVKDYAIFLLDIEGRVTSWNPGAEEMLGYSPAEVLGKHGDAFFTPEDRAAGVPAEEIRQAIHTGRAADLRWHLRKDGERFFVDGVMSAVRDGEGRLVGLSKLMRDVTARKQIEMERERLFEAEQTARTEAERAGRMKDEFLATLSHELRTPLNAILGWTQVLRADPGDAADVAEGLDVIDRNARAQTQIIDDLLDMSRIISGKIRLTVGRVDLASVIEAAAETVRHAAEAKGVRIHTVLDRSAKAVSGDPTRLQQVFWNLLSNSVKFTPRGGKVQVLLQRVESHLEVSVTDTGEGIDPHFLPHVFDRFRQADATTTRRHGGLGLGLAVCKQLIELHGGTIEAESRGLGTGSTFIVKLPLKVIHFEPEEAKSGHGQSTTATARALESNTCASIEGVKVLVVDDEPDARELVRRFLEDCKAVVATAASVSEALHRVQTDRPDVLISDIGMPIEDGYSLIRKLRALPLDRGGRVPAIALTAYARAEDRLNSVRAGFQHHVSKPVEAAELIAIVASLSGRLGKPASEPIKP